MRRLHAFVALDVLFPNVEQTDTGFLQSVDVAGDDRSHRGKLPQLLGRRFRICTQVEHLCMPVRGGYGGDDGWPLASVDGLEDEMRHGGERTRVARTDTGISPARLDQIDG